MRTALDPDLLARIEAHLGRAGGDPLALEGGITNRNYRMRFGTRDAVVRLCGKQAAPLGIDRRTEAIATQRAADLGIGPEVLVRLEDDDVLVCAFVTGAPLSAAGVRDRLGEIAAALRAFHATPPQPTAFDVDALVAEQRAVARALPADYDALLALARRIREAFGDRHDHVPVPCHNDLLAANFLAEPGGGGVRILDWEYAGNNDRCFDLGNLAVNNALDDDEQEALLQAYWDGEVTAGRRAALALMRFVSDFREAMWGAAQQTLSDLDVDYGAYADEHFARLRATASDARMEGWLRDAATA